MKTRLHIASGLVLFVFLTSHFTNHALGLSSVALMEAGRGYFNLVWRSWPGTILLYGALFWHFVLAFDALYRRKSLRMPVSEALKIGFGLALPFLIASHVAGTRLELVLSGHDRGYGDILRVLWSTPANRVSYSVALVLAWSHGCLGLWFWLRGRLWFARAAPLFHMAAVIVPLLALLGFYAAASKISALPPMPAAFVQPHPRLGPIVASIYAVMSMMIAGAMLNKYLPRKNRIRIQYFGGKQVTVTPGFSVLEASRSAGIPHVSVCGGRGRCSTCRIQVMIGLEGQPEPQDREAATLKSINAPADVRLACQLRPVHDLTVLPLVEAKAPHPAAQPSDDRVTGRERMVATLFCDLRGFTQLSEAKLPYDVVFLLNRYFGMVNTAVEASGGIVDKFIGDGVIALFGLEATSFSQACRQALACAARLSSDLEALNTSFNTELDAPLRIAIGLHGGPAIVGRMGHGRAAALTAIGDTMNIASRLEGLAKEHNAELAVSAELVNQARVSFGDHESQSLQIRGRALALETWIVPKASRISQFLGSSATAEDARSETMK